MMGLGYIGLPTAALIASRGIKVQGIDVNKSVVDIINEGKIHIVEPALDGLVKHVVERGLLRASTTPETADVYLIAVPTPFKGDHQPDLKYVESATRMIISKLKEGDLFIIESTSPVGTTDKMAQIIFEERSELKGKIHIAYCPERVLPGKVIYELEHNDRVIGGLDEQSTKVAQDFYRHFVKGELHGTNAKTAEMCKLVENSSRDVSIAFANELSMICDKAGINVWELINLANKHPRVNILQPGTGVGGHCIAVDPWFIVSEFEKEAIIIRNAREINNYKTEWVIEKIKSTALQFELDNNRMPIIALMGLAFKPDIDDLRESPALQVAETLLAENKYHLLLVEPNLEKSDKYDLSDYEKLNRDADIVAYLVAHKEFRGCQFEALELDFCGVKK
ncbi:MAG: UDP-N-acetyl-D-mannosamine dehydrogenase [Flavobacteriales bacterium TMED123]|nr:MAG: UDP-N-acetyl-D-mannosamine dehydrogenase [Flavobacteriales bacterium TMED123]